MSYVGNIRKAVFSQLDKNPLLTAKPLCKLLGLDFVRYGNYVKKLKHDWKGYHPIERGSIRSCPDEVHNVFYRGVLPIGVVKQVRLLLGEVWERAGWDKWVFPEKPLSQTGWKLTKAKNKFLLYKGALGRIRLFDSGTVEVFVRKPANLGKCKQLFSDAFTRHYLVSDIKIMDQFFAGLLCRFHATYKMGQRMPYAKITTFEETHRLTFVIGDRTDPDCAEIIAEYHAEVEQARRLFEELRLSLLGGDVDARSKPLGRDYSV